MGKKQKPEIFALHQRENFFLQYHKELSLLRMTHKFSNNRFMINQGTDKILKEPACL